MGEGAHICNNTLVGWNVLHTVMICNLKRSVVRQVLNFYITIIPSYL